MVVALGLRERLNEDGEVERLCTDCKEYWPADREFFYSGGHGRLQPWCKACYEERRKNKRKKVSHN